MKTELHEFTIRRKDRTKPMRPGNVELFMDGRPLKGVQSLTFDLDMHALPKLKIEMIVGGVDIEAEIEEQPAP